MVWWYVAVFVAALVVSYALTPKPQNQKPAAFEDLQLPTAEEGREIPVVFGTRDIKSSNVVWYGDLRTVAVKKKGGKK
ncbi:MAG: hypothetical protein EAS51_12380 [Microbacteriaceae bacterium]|uniref:Virion structural protein n=1 Tax=Bordetella phage MW2 TaxID=1916126 RepID=A0A2D0W981_9CAUD|nr:tail assembly chaperone [Bordetella phage MW2]APL99214.1 virion structural protein [Bordetella phage MW2]RQP09208.1 MAG: hypothetical protein EAS51_12380 [Microbacteriaceae bacterium]